MPTSTQLRRMLFPFAAAITLALLILVVPAPASVSVVGTRWLSSLGSHFAGVDLVSEVGLMLLAVMTLATAARAWVRHPEHRAHLAVGAFGVAVAYAASEGAKMLFAQPRPCTRWPSAAECPPLGDWSLPSNHATLAFAAVVVIALTAGRTWVTWAALTLAVLVALGRVAQGVHYLHDVALGAGLGLAVPAALVAVAVWLKPRSGPKPTLP